MDMEQLIASLLQLKMIELGDHISVIAQTHGQRLQLPTKHITEKTLKQFRKGFIYKVLMFDLEKESILIDTKQENGHQFCWLPIGKVKKIIGYGNEIGD